MTSFLVVIRHKQCGVSLKPAATTIFRQLISLFLCRVQLLSPSSDDRLQSQQVITTNKNQENLVDVLAPTISQSGNALLATACFYKVFVRLSLKEMLVQPQMPPHMILYSYSSDEIETRIDRISNRNTSQRHRQPSSRLFQCFRTKRCPRNVGTVSMTSNGPPAIVPFSTRARTAQPRRH
jgi:hypothetical protein